MKLVVSYVRRRMLRDVLAALQAIDGLTGASISESKGFGRGRAQDAEEETSAEGFLLSAKMHLEIYCEDHICSKVIETILETAHTGHRGDGKIYVIDVENAYRISTGATGIEAI